MEEEWVSSAALAGGGGEGGAAAVAGVTTGGVGAGAGVAGADDDSIAADGAGVADAAGEEEGGVALPAPIGVPPVAAWSAAASGSIDATAKPSVRPFSVGASDGLKAMTRSIHRPAEAMCTRSVA